MENASQVTSPTAAVAKVPGSEVPFGMNEVRLGARLWLIAFAILLVVALLTPWFWAKLERFETGPDYRMPYELSKDYWLYNRRLHQVADSRPILLLGDSVVWGEYVLSDGTLSHFLNGEAGETNRFINAGVNGLFPLALEGLIRCYGSPLRDQKVILHCNLLWMTSPKADLSTDKEEQFNHARLVPQFYPRIPCYRADANDRLNAIVERNVTFLGWVSHLQDAYFGEKSIPKWTLEDAGGNPPHYPNAWRNPLSPITFTVPAAPANDPQRGPQSPRHKPWSTNATGTTQFEWVGLDQSLQWGAFQRAVNLLREQGNELLVVVGPFNEHMMAQENRPACRKLRDGVLAWLSQSRIPHVTPDLLPSALYADASHPLTEGYRLIAQQLHRDEGFQRWLAGR